MRRGCAREGCPTHRLTSRRAVCIVAVASALVHLVAAGSVPLVITPDGQEYITAAYAIQDGTGWSRPFRTPGYPALLVMAFALLGRGGAAILLMNHLLAWGTCVLVARSAVVLAGPVWGIAAGLLLAIEPWSLVLSGYALTETLAAAVVAASASVAVCCRGDRSLTAIGLGALLTGACLTRPSLQVIVPWIGLAWVLRLPVSNKRRLVLGAILAGSFVATSAPWLTYNAARGVRGYARGFNSALWYGVTSYDLLDREYSVDEELSGLIQANLSPAPRDHEIALALWKVDAYEDAVRDSALGRWARASIRKRPLSYARAAFYTLLWQLNCGIQDKPPTYDELPFFARRPFIDGTRTISAVAPNFQGAGTFPDWPAFSMGWRGGVLQPWLEWWSAGHVRGLPQIPLFLCALAAVVLAVRCREWGVAALCGGTLLFVAFHCALLIPVTRYAMPAWTLWYISAAWVLSRGAFRNSLAR